jgi:hypothetical protein
MREEIMVKRIAVRTCPSISTSVKVGVKTMKVPSSDKKRFAIMTAFII